MSWFAFCLFEMSPTVYVRKQTAHPVQLSDQVTSKHAQHTSAIDRHSSMMNTIVER